MELHTLGVGGGYSQEDVTSLARIITGWTFAGRQGRLGTPGIFAFNANAHQPGPQTLLGKTTRTPGLRRAKRRSRTSRAIPRPRNSSRPNSPVTSWPTTRRRRWWRGCSRHSANRTAISAYWQRRWWIPTRRGGRRKPRSAAPMNIWWRRTSARANSRRPQSLSRRAEFVGPAFMDALGPTGFPTPMRPGPRRRG